MKNFLKLATGFASVALLSIGPVVQAAPQALIISIMDDGFSPKQVVSAVNRQVQIEVYNKGSRTHQFSIPYYRIYTENIKPGGKESISFSPATTGQFQIMSDPSGKNLPEFSGTFVVTDSK